MLVKLVVLAAVVLAVVVIVKLRKAGKAVTGASVVAGAKDEVNSAVAAVKDKINNK